MNEPRRLINPISILWAISILGVGIVLWLMYAYDIRYFGPVPSLVIFLVPAIFALWLNTLKNWPHIKKQPYKSVMIYCSILLLVVSLLLMVKWS